MAVVRRFSARASVSALVSAAWNAADSSASVAVVVLGHPSYYSRFGFQPSTDSGFCSEYDAPGEAFMLLELQPGYLHGASGTVHFHEAFKDV